MCGATLDVGRAGSERSELIGRMAALVGFLDTLWELEGGHMSEIEKIDPRYFISTPELNVEHGFQG